MASTITNLNSFYASKGSSIPKLAVRAQEYERQGLGKASEYQGTVDQNAGLLSRLMKPSAPTSSGPLATSTDRTALAEPERQGSATIKAPSTGFPQVQENRVSVPSMGLRAAQPVQAPKPTTIKTKQVAAPAPAGAPQPAITSPSAPQDPVAPKSLLPLPQQAPALSQAPQAPRSPFVGILDQLMARGGVPRDRYGNVASGLDTRVQNSDGSFNPSRPDAQQLFNQQSQQAITDAQEQTNALVARGTTPIQSDAAMNQIASMEQQRLSQIEAARGNALQQQGLQQQALAQAGQLTPEALRYGAFGTGGLDPQSAASQLAQKVLSGQMTYEQAASSLGYAGGAGTQFLNAAIQQIDPNANIPQLSAQVAANAQNLTTAGTVGTQTAAAGYQDAVKQYQDTLTNFQTADGQAQLLLQTMQANGINPSSSTDANQAMNVIAQRLSAPGQQQYQQTLAAVRAAYTNMLTAGGGTIPTEATSAADAILNPNSSLAAFTAAVQQFQREGGNILTPLYQKAQTYYGQLQQGSGGYGNAAGGGGDLYTF